MKRDALDQLLRDLEAERHRPAPGHRRTAGDIDEPVPARTLQQQADARAQLEQDVLAYDEAHRGDRRLRAVS